MLGRPYEHQAVAAYAFVAVAPKDGERFGVVYRRFERVDVDVVVARTVHFRKLDGLAHRWFLS